MYQNSLKYGDMVDWKNLGFEYEGNGKQCYAEFEPRNASLFLPDLLYYSTLKNWKYPTNTNFL